MQLVFRPDVQEILNSFTALLGIRMGFFSATGEELRVGENKLWCRYCTLLRTRLGQDQRCRDTDRIRLEEARERAALVHYECHGGMVEAIKPILLQNGHLLGYVMIGQLRVTDTPPAEHLFAWNRRYKTNELREAFLEAPCFDQSRLHHVLGLFSSLVDYIVHQHMIRIETKGHLEQIVAHMEKHCDIQFSLPEAAGLVGKSPSRVAHLFREQYGASFKEVQSEIILDKADWLMRHDPHITVKEVAAALGFRDPLYFSRFYRRKRGIAPSRQRHITVDGAPRQETGPSLAPP